MRFERFLRKIRSRSCPHWAFLTFVASTSLVSEGSALQSTIAGRVLSDNGRTVGGAELSISGTNTVVFADTLGRFRIGGLSPGSYKLLVKHVGFQPDTSFIHLGNDESFSRDIHLRRAQTNLPEVVVTTGDRPTESAKLAVFSNRRRRNLGGHFLDEEVIQRWTSRKTGDLVSTVPGVDLSRAGGKAFAVGSRAVQSLTPSARGDPCYMDVYLDGALVYSKANAGNPLFDLNSVNLTEIAAIEVYTGASNMPPELNRTSKGCGVVVIWTR